MSTATYRIPAIAKLREGAKVTLPGSKSIALRQLAMSALCEGTSVVVGIPECDDTEAMLDCLAELGVNVARDGTKITLSGPMDFSSDVQLNARMSGASTRLLIGLAALRYGKTNIDGHESLRLRTNQPLLDVLNRHDCAVHSDGGGLPLELQGPLQDITELQIDGSLSSQYITALLLAAPYVAAQEFLQISIIGDLVSRPYIDITLHEMAKRGVHAQWQDQRTLLVARGRYQAMEVQVEGDASAATYFAALATLHGGQIELTNLGANTKQGDYAFLEIMETLGAEVQRHDGATLISGPPSLAALEQQDMTSMPDAALTLIALAPLLPKPCTLTGLSSLHHKECDRLERPADEFKALGIQASTTHDSIHIEPVSPKDIRDHVMQTYHDHRMAMAFSLIGSATGTLTVDDKSVVNKTYPNYWRDYAMVSELSA